VHQSEDQHLERGRWHASTDLSQLTQSSETARYRSLNVRPHRQVSVDVSGAQKSNPLKLFAVFSATAWNFCVTFTRLRDYPIYYPIYT